jgi:hypothetical protein
MFAKSIDTALLHPWYSNHTPISLFIETPELCTSSCLSFSSWGLIYDLEGRGPFQYQSAGSLSTSESPVQDLAPLVIKVAAGCSQATAV